MFRKLLLHLFLGVVLLFVNAFSLKAFDPVLDDNQRWLIVEDVYVDGNIKTHKDVILSELPFFIGSSINLNDLMDQIARAKENLRNTSLFNFVEIEFFYPDSRSIVFLVTVQERWYIWAFPIFEQEGRNFSDFLRLNDGSYFNYGLYVKHDNFRGRRETLRFRMITGYKKQFVFDYQNPGFNQQSGWGFNVSWLWKDQIAYTTKGDKQVFIKTLGDRLLTQYTIQLSYSYRHNLDHHHRVFMEYQNLDASDTLVSINDNFLPGGQGSSETLEVGYRYVYDRRDSKVYPLSGSFIDVDFSRKGVSISSNYKGYFHLHASASYQQEIRDRFYFSSVGFVSASDTDDIPYIFRTGLGYDEFLNGFEFYVIDGSSYAGAKNKFLYELVSRRDKTLNWMPLDQFSHFHYAFYLNMHFDAGYVLNNNVLEGNIMSNSLLLGYGLGIDMVTFYDKVLSLNYTFNNFANQGFYFDFNLSF